MSFEIGVFTGALIALISFILGYIFCLLELKVIEKQKLTKECDMKYLEKQLKGNDADEHTSSN